MAIISKKSFDKLSEVEKKSIQTDYQDLLSDDGNWINSLTSEERSGAIMQLEWMFGKETLLSEIKTWEDVQEMNEDSNFFMRIDDNLELSDKVYSKCIATLKIAKLIELGYGGAISDEEWRNDKIPKYYIAPNHNVPGALIMSTSYKSEDMHFIAFHTPEQMAKFISYESNRILMKQYYMI